MFWFGIISCLVAVACLVLLIFNSSKLNGEKESLLLAQADRNAKVGFMHRELTKMFWDKKNQVSKYYLGGMLDAMENEMGTKPYPQFLGWRMAQKQANRRKQ